MRTDEIKTIVVGVEPEFPVRVLPLELQPSRSQDLRQSQGLMKRLVDDFWNTHYVLSLLDAIALI